MSRWKPLCARFLKYNQIVGTGGIGSGLFFKLEGNHTLGRNESRLGELVPYKDFCKLHIILHYISTLLGSGQNSEFTSYAIGKVGSDDIGRQMVAKMREAGINTEGVGETTHASTLFSVCFQYPDSTGGNITTSNSASGLVSCEDIDLFFQRHGSLIKNGIVLAAPEVPAGPRKRILEHGRERGTYNVASLLSSEAEEFKKQGVFPLIDLLAVNIDEACAIAGITSEDVEPRTAVESCVRELVKYNPEMSVVVTNGPEGSFGFDGKDIEYIPALPTKAVGTGGAGDAMLSGIIVGLTCGLPLLKGRNDAVFSETPLNSSIELGTLLASLSVTSPDTIHEEADGMLLLQYARQKEVRFSPELEKLFEFDC